MLEGFDNWWHTNRDTCHDKTGHFDIKDAELAWKAALEWAKEIAQDELGMTLDIIDKKLQDE